MKNFSNELTYRTSRSSGAGGQHVNKVETAVTVMWKPADTEYFLPEETELIQQKLKNRINTEGILHLTVSESRTQLQNKKIATEKIIDLVNKALIKPKIRKPTKPSRKQVEKRIQAKKQLSEKKENRKFRW